MQTPRERFAEVLRNGVPDTVPFFPRDLTLGLDALGIPTPDVFGPPYDSKKSAEGILALQRMCGHDAVVGCIFGCMVTGFGADLGMPENGVPYPLSAPFEDLSSMDSASPDDVRDRMLEGMRGSYSEIRRRRDDLAVVMNLAGPVTNAGNLRNMEVLMMDFAMDPEAASRVLRFSVDSILSAMEYLGGEDSDAVIMASATDNPDLIGSDLFSEFCVPALKEIADSAKRMGLPCMFHPHGRFDTPSGKELLLQSVRTGIDCFHFSEENDGPAVRDAVGGRCSIMGGPDVNTVLMNGDAGLVRKDTERFLDDFDGTPYILSCSCSVHRGFPIDRLRLMAETAGSRRH